MVTSAGDDLSAGASAVGGAIGGFMIIVICLVIGLVGGLIIGAFAKKPEKEQNSGKSIGILFLVILGLSIFYLNQISEIEKVIKGDNIESSDFINTTNTGTIEKKSLIEENNNKSSEVKLTDLIGFKLVSYNLVEGDYSKSFEFGTEIENKSGKDILGYKGSFEVFDMFDDKLGKFNLGKIGNFNSGAILKEKENYSYNEFMSDNVKLGKSKFENLKYKYSIEQIIYKDDYNYENKIFGNNTGKDIDKIEYRLLNKKSKKKEIIKIL
ncbi:MAG: hypothetical protein Q9M97_10225 [Candidatus Gracilibacteria bacterium]|nr:hypothetical protein [Candidatus Gracilibacteria bacterium]